MEDILQKGSKISICGRYLRRKLAIYITLMSAAAVASFAPIALTQTQQATAATVLVTGSNRGIGLEFVRQYVARGWTVIATCRNPEAADELKQLAAERPNIIIEKLDVLDHDMIDALAGKYRGTPIDVLLNNAGISGGYENQKFGSIKYEFFDRVMATNFIAPLKMAEAFIDHVAASDQKKIINISSMPSSIKRGAARLYMDHSSKTALNMVMHILSKDVADLGVIVGLVAPGLVDTDLTQGLDIPKISPEQSVVDLIDIIDNYTIEMSGSLIQHTGQILPW